MTSCCENNLLLNQKDALERLANTIENMPENNSNRPFHGANTMWLVLLLEVVS